MNTHTARPAAGPKRTLPLIGLALLMLAGIALWAVLGTSQPTDTEQIYGILSDIREGVAKQDVGETASHFSSGFTVEGLNRAEIRLQILQFYRQHANTSVLFEDQSTPAITGDTASTDVTVALSASPNAGGPSQPVFSQRISLDFGKEPARRFLILPTHVWKITGVRMNRNGLEHLIGL